jgi:hypothetical protein
MREAIASVLTLPLAGIVAVLSEDIVANTPAEKGRPERP